MIQCDYTPCSKLFKPRWPRQKYCTPSCSYAARSAPKVEVVCSNTTCGKTFKRKVSQTNRSKHGFQFCSRQCKDFAQSLKGDCTEIRPTHYGTGTGRHTYRRFLAEKKNPRCGCGEKRRYLLVVHHRDGNHDNNVRSNLEIVCFNCHACRHLTRDDQGVWRYHSKSLTAREFLSGV